MTHRAAVKWMILLALLLAVVCGLNIYLAIKAGEFTRFKQQFENAQQRQPEIDYAVIDRLIAGHLSELPTPKDGANGLNGRDGRDGSSGRDGVDGKDGTDGLPGIPGREIELAKDTEGNILWRYTGDDFWTVLEVKE